MTPVRRVNAPKHASMYAPTCAVCGHEELEHPVWLSDGRGDAFPAGTGCAARLLGTSIADLEADIATSLIREADERLMTALRTFFVDLPSRVTPQYLAHVATRVTRYGGTDSPAQVAEAAASIYRALKRAKRDYRATLRGAKA